MRVVLSIITRQTSDRDENAQEGIMTEDIVNIAVVDDDEISRKVIQNNLMYETGYKTVLFSSGEKFVEYSMKNKVDLVLLDIEMPNLNGMQVYDLIKKIERTKEIPVIFLTGKDDKETVLKCIGKGADGYLVKPVEREKLVAKIKDAINKINAYRTHKVVLMVDDDVEFLKLAKMKLSKYYKVLSVNSGKTAIEYLSDHKVDIILLDYMMPLYDGKNILNILRHRESTKNIPVILITSLRQEEIFKECCNNMPDKVLCKPVNIDELLENIRRFTTSTSGR